MSTPRHHFPLFLFCLYWFTQSSGIAVAQQAENDGARAQFEAFLKEASRSWGLQTNGYEEKWAKWSGFTSEEGMAAITEGIINYDNHDRSTLPRMTLAHRLMDAPSFDRSKMASFLKVKAEGAQADPNLFSRYLSLLERAKSYDERGIVAFVAAQMTDTRSAEVNARHPESQSGQTIRVCDVANARLMGWLMDKGHLKPGDPGMGDVGGESSWIARNKQIDTVNEKLLQLGLISRAVRPDDNAATPPPPRATPTPTNQPQPQTGPPPPPDNSDPFSGGIYNPDNLPDPFASGPITKPIPATATAEPTSPPVWVWLSLAATLTVLSLTGVIRFLKTRR